ncbi:hypothetical protein [Alkalibacillus haloalkaliphilus]|uniref:Uncharacterized protein n=1 Tax=Alkalibacillus haloalkaliphilus TaxID=94136 RepID=A0A511W5C7_9BACI|nr:hypothetical protein [Alkalibacillus haloalkaliphilus]GEN46306.1 hypothetical protein AHA02nite_20820 [Alkalibacillus haloalkaliphilus]
MSLWKLIVVLLSITILMAIPVESQIHAPVIYYLIIIPLSIIVLAFAVFERRIEKSRKKRWDRIRKWKRWQGISYYITIQFVWINMYMVFLAYVIYGLNPILWLAELSINIKIFLTLVFVLMSTLGGSVTYYDRGKKYGFKKLSEIMK